MAVVRVHELRLDRVPEAPPPPMVRVHEMKLTRTPPEIAGPTVRIHGMWLSRNFDTPTPFSGGVFAIRNGQWVEAEEILGISNGQWT